MKNENRFNCNCDTIMSSVQKAGVNLAKHAFAKLILKFHLIMPKLPVLNGKIEIIQTMENKKLRHVQ